jgi:hypothetical protein
MLHELTSGDDARAESVVPDFVRLGEAALHSLTQLIESANPDHRWWALRTLTAMNFPMAQVLLRESLADPDPSVRQCAALGLREQASSSAIAPLIDALHDPDRLVARLAGDALIAIGTEAIPALSRSLRSSDPNVRIEAARALAGMKDPQISSALFSALDDPSRMVEYWAEQGLERLGIGMVFFKPKAG